MLLNTLYSSIAMLLPLVSALPKKERLLLFTMLLIGILFLAFWAVVLWKTYKLSTQSKVITDIDHTFKANRLVTTIAAVISVVVAIGYFLYWYGFLGTYEVKPQQQDLLMVLGIVCFGSTPYVFSIVFGKIKNLKVKHVSEVSIKTSETKETKK